MGEMMEMQTKSRGFLDSLVSLIGRIVVALFIPTVTFIVLWQGFIFLRDSEAPQWLVVIVAIIWGVGGVAALYFVANWLVEKLSPDWVRRLQPFVFVGPAIAILFWYLALPALRTFYLSLRNANSTEFVGLRNYLEVFTNRVMLEAFRNNLMWILFGATLSVVLGLLVAYLMVSAEVFLATHAQGVFRMASFGFGPTELRIVLAIGALCLFRDPHVNLGALGSYRLFDFGGVVAIAGMAIALVISAIRNTRSLYLAETTR